MSFFKKVGNLFIEAQMRNAKVRVHQQLMRMSDRQLEDSGFSKALVADGVEAWPWRAIDESEQLPGLALAARPAVLTADESAVKQAIAELSDYSDRELADLGVSRGSLEDAVRYGRAEVEGVFDNRKHAA